MPNRYTLETRRCPKNPGLPISMCPPKREFNPHPRSLSKETLKEMALDRVNSRDQESPTQTDFEFTNVTEDKPKTNSTSFRPSGNIKPLKQITKLTETQLEKGKLVAASYQLNEYVNNLNVSECKSSSDGTTHLDCTIDCLLDRL